MTLESIEKIRSVYARFPEIEKAVLYGPRAKGNYKTGSDIDFTLYGTTLTSELRASIAEALDDLLLPYTIDLSLCPPSSCIDTLKELFNSSTPS